MKFKKFITMFILTFILMINVSFALPILQLVVDEVNPLPVEPGEDMTVKVRIENIGDSSAEDIIIERVYDFPFRLEYELQEEVNIGFLGVDQSKELSFYISVSPKAKTGVYPLTFNIKEGIKSVSQDVLINVVGKPDVIFTVNTLEENIVPDESFNVNLNLANIGTGNARNIKISSDYDNFAFKDSGLVLIDNLKSQESKNISLDILVDSDVTSGLYQIPIKVEMIGENGQVYSSEQKLNINVIDSAEVTLKDIKIKPANAVVGSPINVEVRVENIGVGSADNVYVELKFDEGTPVTGNKKAYIGHLEINDESPAFFNLNSKVSGKFPAKILIHYTDDLGEHTTSESLNISYKEDTSIDYTLYLGIFALFIVLIFLFKKLRK